MKVPSQNSRRWRQRALLALAAIQLLLQGFGGMPCAHAGLEFGQEVPLAGLAEPARKDVYDLVLNMAMVRLGYSRVQKDAPDRGQGLTTYCFLTRQESPEARRELLLGLKDYATRGSCIYLWGQRLAGQEAEPNPDVPLLAEAVQSTAIERRQAAPVLTPRELIYETYQLSFIDPDGCLETLKQLGYMTTPPPPEVTAAQLPAIFKLSSKVPASIVGQKAPISEKTLTEETVTVPDNRLMIAYCAGQEAQVGALKNLLETTIDVPERQVLIEGLVIELTERDLKELGVQWRYVSPDWKLTFLAGTKNVPFVGIFNPELTSAEQAGDRLRATLTAIIQEGRGEILSSPSVLVLNNRNAKIEVVRDVPVLQTLVTAATTNIKIDFITVGIILNIKPRISQDDSTVAMQVLVEVSEAPAEDFIILQGQSVAPQVNRRKVETVARVRDNTPFIIGGLIRNEKARQVDRIPLLSRIPVLGALFQRRSDRMEKREVIIVLTPRVIKAAGETRPVLPKDSERFDFLDNRLFRNSYRIKSEDVFDLSFLETNPTILEAFERARIFVRKHPQYAQQSPFKELAARIIPGEDAVVIRMLYEIAKKSNLHTQVIPKNLIFFERDPGKPAGFAVKFLWRKLAEAVPDVPADQPEAVINAYFAREGYPRRVLLLRWNLEAGHVLQEALRVPAADAEWVTINSRGEIESMILGINRLSPQYRYQQFAFILDNAKDLERLQAAIALREVAKVNGFEELLAIKNFRAGRRIVMPELDGPAGRIFLVDHLAAEYFFKSDYYYHALETKLEQGYAIFNEALKKEGEL